MAKSSLHRQARLESLVRAREAGVLIAMGTDAGTPKNEHGQNAKELLQMVEVGFSPQEALIAATSLAADLLGLADVVGSLQKGLTADLLIVEGDPAHDLGVLAQTEKILAVFRSGELVSGSWTQKEAWPETVFGNGASR